MKCPFRRSVPNDTEWFTEFGDCDPQCAMLVHCPDNPVAHTACAFAVMASSSTNAMGFSPVNELSPEDIPNC